MVARQKATSRKSNEALPGKHPANIEEEIKKGDESSSEGSSFYDEIFYDAVSENTFVGAVPVYVNK